MEPGACTIFSSNVQAETFLVVVFALSHNACDVEVKLKGDSPPLHTEIGCDQRTKNTAVFTVRAAG